MIIIKKYVNIIFNYSLNTFNTYFHKLTYVT